MLDLSEIKQRYENGGYRAASPDPFRFTPPKDGVYDEEKSVKWNREELERHRAAHAEALQAYRKAQAELDRKLHQDVVDYISLTYNLKLASAQILEGIVYEEKHSSMSDYFYAIDEAAENIVKIVHAEKGEQ